MVFTPEIFTAALLVVAFFTYKAYRWLWKKKAEDLTPTSYPSPIPEDLSPLPILEDIYLISWDDNKNPTQDEVEKAIEHIKKAESFDSIESIDDHDFINDVPEHTPRQLAACDVMHKSYTGLKVNDLSSIPLWYEGAPVTILVPHELVGIIQRHFELFTEKDGYVKLLNYDDYREFLSEYDIKIQKDLRKDPAFPTDPKTYSSSLPKEFFKSDYDPTLSLDLNSNLNNKTVKYTDGKNRIAEREINDAVLYKSYMKQFWPILIKGIYPTKVAFEYWFEEATKESPLGEEKVYTVKESGEAIKDYVKGNKDYYDNLYKKLYEE